MKLDTTSESKLYRLHSGTKVICQLAQDIRNIQARLVDVGHIEPWQVTSAYDLRMGLWVTLLSHPNWEAILDKVYFYGVDFNEDVEVELFGIDSTKDYKDYINDTIDMAAPQPHLYEEEYEEEYGSEAPYGEQTDQATTSKWAIKWTLPWPSFSEDMAVCSKLSSKSYDSLRFDKPMLPTKIRQ
jgi:hypothetical protein